MKTKNITKVLIALDYNPTAKKVAELGFSMAKSMNAEIVLLHVAIDPVLYSASGYSPIMGFTGYDYNPEMMSESVQGLKICIISVSEQNKRASW